MIILTNEVSYDSLEPYTKIQIYNASLLSDHEHLWLYIYQLEIYQFIKSITMFRVGTVQPFFRILNIVLHDIVEPLNTVQIQYVPLFSTRIHIQYGQVWTPTTIFFENLIQCHMTDLNFSPKLKYSTIFCCEIRNIFGIYKSTRSRSVHENHQHVQGWNPTTNFTENRKNSKYIYIQYFFETKNNG